MTTTPTPANRSLASEHHRRSFNPLARDVSQIPEPTPAVNAWQAAPNELRRLWAMATDLENFIEKTDAEIENRLLASQFEPAQLNASLSDLHRVALNDDFVRLQNSKIILATLKNSPNYAEAVKVVGPLFAGLLTERDEMESAATAAAEKLQALAEKKRIAIEKIEREFSKAA